MNWGVLHHVMSVLLVSIVTLHHAYSGTQLIRELSAIMNVNWRGLFAIFADVAWAALHSLVALHGTVLCCSWHLLLQLQVSCCNAGLR